MAKWWGKILLKRAQIIFALGFLKKGPSLAHGADDFRILDFDVWENFLRLAWGGFSWGFDSRVYLYPYAQFHSSILPGYLKRKNLLWSGGPLWNSKVHKFLGIQISGLSAIGWSKIPFKIYFRFTLEVSKCTWTSNEVWWKFWNSQIFSDDFAI